MGILKIIEWKDESKNQIVYKINCAKDYINRGSKVIVRESQACIFSDKGRMADVFLPGTYSLDTNNIPIITKLLSWKYGFESPFKSDVFFVNTKQFANNRWGTINPIIVRDSDFGNVRIRGYGTYSFRVKDPYKFMCELSGTNSSYKTEDIQDWLRSIVVTGVTDAIGESKTPILDMAADLLELGETVKNTMQEDLDKIGIELVKFNFENFSLPENLEKALDKQTEMNIMRKNMDVYTQMAQADALKEAAKNPGMAGSMMGAGIGLGMGANMGKAFSDMSQDIGKPQEEQVKCSKCGTMMKKSAKFCPECGTPNGIACPKCGAIQKEGAKFCSECGASLKVTCRKCGAELAPGIRFCPECGTKQ